MSKPARKSSVTASQKAFRPNIIKQFQRAVRDLDLAGMKEALDAGVHLETPVNMDHPLSYLLFRTYDEYLKTHPEKKKLTEDQFETSITALIEELLARGIKLVEPEKHADAFSLVLMDRLLPASRESDAALIVLHAIEQSFFANNTAYIPHLMGMVKRDVLKSDDADVEDTFGYMSGYLERLHHNVRILLTESDLPVARSIMDYADQVPNMGYWTDEFIPPQQKHFAEELTELTAFVLEDIDEKIAEASGFPISIKTQKKEPDMAQFIEPLVKKTPQQVLAETEADFIGLDEQKRNLRKVYLKKQYLAACAAAGAEYKDTAGYSTLYMGPPGTGKTTIARKKAELLHALDLVGPRYVEITREKLMGQYVGQTEAKWVELMQNADVIFIDEAYALYDGSQSSSDFGRHIITALLGVLEKDRTKTVFLAGYKDKMEEFLNANEGLRSRISHFEQLEPMTIPQLGEVFDLMERKKGRGVEPEARAIVLLELEKAQKALGPQFFGNAREVRKVSDKLAEQIAERLFGSGAASITDFDAKTLTTVTVDDIRALDLPSLLGTKGKEQLEKRGIGFLADIPGCVTIRSAGSRYSSSNA